MISTDARSRFERGIDPAAMPVAVEQASRMILDLCGGEASEAAVVRNEPADGFPNAERRSSPIVLSAFWALAGVESVGRSSRRRSSNGSASPKSRPSEIRVPTWRPDVDGEADLVEEIARINGYDQIPSTPLDRGPGVAHPTATRSQRVERHARRAAAARGLNEAVTWSFIAEEDADQFGGARLGAQESDQRGHEGDAALAIAGPDRCHPPQLRPRCRRCSSVRDRPPLPRRRESG